MIRIAVFASGEGTNLQALINAVQSRRIRGEIALVISTNEKAGALTRAHRHNIPSLVLKPKDFPTGEEYSAALSAECKKREVELICLAGFMFQLKNPLLGDFKHRILNIHPALLPAFGGKGMYGHHVHDAVIKSGAKVSGCTVHVVDEIYDHGSIISQNPVPVFPGDTGASLAARIRSQEHWAYPEAVRLFCEGRLEIKDDGVQVKPSHKDHAKRIQRALVSVSDKTGLIELCRGLSEMDIEIVSTSGTAKALAAAGIEVRWLETLTGYPEILNGRVKTLHPKIHGGILFKRGDASQAREAQLLGLEPIDMVVVNLYPFAETVAKAKDAHDPEVIEQIDIGGVTLIRAASKNFEDVAIVVSPSDYPGILKELEKNQCQLSQETRKRLALSGFKHTAEYDKMISDAWSGGAAPSPAISFPNSLPLNLNKVQDLRYGENPHQKAALYARENGISFTQEHGKELSYNNLLDAAGAWDAACDFDEPSVALFKHVTPCGLANGQTLLEAFDRAWACDPLSAFGGIMAVNRRFEKAVAEKLGKRFMEVIIAPDYEPEALALLKQKPNLRILTKKKPLSPALQIRTIGDEVLITEPDHRVFGDELKVVTKRSPSEAEMQALKFAWTSCKHVKSNAIVLAGPHQTVGIGAGQMSRVDSVHMAGVKFKMYLKDNPQPKALVLASDAFFPFRDGIDAASTLGISALIQPGGSVRDTEVIAAADEHELAMVMTGMRHFRH